MKNELNYYRILKYFFMIIFPAAIILGNFNTLILNEKFYQFLYLKSGTYNNFKRENVVNLETGNLIGYFRGQNQLDVNFYSNQATFHLIDVKKLVVSSSQLFLLIFLLTIFIIFYLLRHRQVIILLNALFMSSVATLVSIILLSLGLAAAFDWIFIRFHLLVFSNNYWLFEESDSLIKLFPQQFFVNFANQLAMNVFISALLITIFSYLSFRNFKNETI